MQLLGFTAGTGFEIRWAESMQSDPSAFERVAAGTSPAGTTTVELPGRDGGFWLLWLTELPIQPDGSYFAELSELRLRP
jgi:hypothetical protein